MVHILSLEQNRDLILDKEKHFCQHISAEIRNKQQLAEWMIFIPIFIIFYLWQLQRYSQRLRVFPRNIWQHVLVHSIMSIQLPQPAKANGTPFENLVRSAYPLKRQFRYFTDNLHRTKHELFVQLQPDLEIDQSEADDVKKKMSRFRHHFGVANWPRCFPEAAALHILSITQS